MSGALYRPMCVGKKMRKRCLASVWWWLLLFPQKYILAPLVIVEGLFAQIQLIGFEVSVLRARKDNTRKVPRCDMLWPQTHTCIMQFTRFSVSLSLSVGLSVSPTESLSPSLSVSLTVSLVLSLSHTLSPKRESCTQVGPGHVTGLFSRVTSRRLDPSRDILLVPCHIFLISIFLIVYFENVSYREVSTVSCLLKVPRIQGRCLKISSSR